MTCTVAGKLPHIMIVSDKKSSDGTPLILHNIGSGAGPETSHERMAGGVADRSGTVRIRKIRAALEEAIHIWCERLRVSCLCSSPIIQIIDGDKENVRRF